jgi:putative transposase
VSLKGMSDSGPTTAAADALANDKETPTSPSAGTTSFRRFRGEACFVFGILQSSKPMLRRCRVGFGPACGKTADLARKHGLSEATLYNWKAKYGGMDVSDAKRLRALEDENRKLKKLLAESMLDQAALKELLTKKW